MTEGSIIYFGRPPLKDGSTRYRRCACCRKWRFITKQNEKWVCAGCRGSARLGRWMARFRKTRKV